MGTCIFAAVVYNITVVPISIFQRLEYSNYQVDLILEDHLGK